MAYISKYQITISFHKRGTYANGWNDQERSETVYANAENERIAIARAILEMNVNTGWEITAVDTTDTGYGWYEYE